MYLIYPFHAVGPAPINGSSTRPSERGQVRDHIAEEGREAGGEGRALPRRTLVQGRGLDAPGRGAGERERLGFLPFRSRLVQAFLSPSAQILFRSKLAFLRPLRQRVILTFHILPLRHVLVPILLVLPLRYLIFLNLLSLR